MYTKLVFIFGFLTAIILAEPVSCETVDRRTPGQALCGTVQSAADQTRLGADANARLREAEINSPPESELPAAFPEENATRAGSSNLRTDRKLFESLLVNWRFFEDLSGRQRLIVSRLISRCGFDARRASLAASVFGQLNPSQRASFVGVTHAMLHTLLIDRDTEEPLGDALELVDELMDIQGENGALPSDQQFQLIVRLAPDSQHKLEHAVNFEQGENHIFHKDYPISFRQFRKMGLIGQEAGLHFSLTRDGNLAQIHIDYRFGLLHLEPANSDVRAEGNHQRHADRWSKFSLVIRPARVRRVVL